MTNVIRQPRICVSRKDFDAARYAHLKVLQMRDERQAGIILPDSSLVTGLKNWLGREDSNLRVPDPKTGALPLGYAPINCLNSSSNL